MRQHQNQNQNQNKNRSRGRARKPGTQSNRTFDSNGPDVKIRGSASHIYEKYQSLSRDANAAGDRIGAENYMQHAEHYFRLMAAAQAAQQTREQQNQPRQKQDKDEEAASSGKSTPAEASAVAALPVERAKAPEASDARRQKVPSEAETLPAAYRPDEQKKEASGDAEAEQKPVRKRRPRQPKVEPRVEAKVEVKAETKAPADSAVADDATA